MCSNLYFKIKISLHFYLRVNFYYELHLIFFLCIVNYDIYNEILMRFQRKLILELNLSCQFVSYSNLLYILTSLILCDTKFWWKLGESCLFQGWIWDELGILSSILFGQEFRNLGILSLYRKFKY